MLHGPILDDIERMRNARNGLMGLDANAKAAIANIPTGTDASSVAIGNDSRLNALVDTYSRILKSPLDSTGTLLLVSGTAYWVYLGRTAVEITPKHVEIMVRTDGAGVQTAEVCLASGSSGPRKSNVTLTKLVADGSVDDLTVGATKTSRNSSAMSTPIAAGTHLYAGIRTAMSITQPTLLAMVGDFGQGWGLTTAAAGALTGAGPWTGSIIAASAIANVPDLRVALD